MLWDHTISKGPSPVNPLDEGEPTSGLTTRRGLLGAGALGAAVALAVGRPAGASVPPAYEGEQSTLLEFAMHLELTARDLYDAAVDAGADPTLLERLSEQHESYAQSIAGLIGASANGRVDDLFESAEANFATSDTDAVIAAAYDLESTAVATHTELLGLLVDTDASKLVASILVIEARHCTVLADAGGRGDDLDAMLSNDAEPIVPQELS